MVTMNEKSGFATVYKVIWMVSIVLTVGMFVGCKQSGSNESMSGKDKKTETLAEALSFEIDADYAVLQLLRTNNVEKAREMLELNMFLLLQQIWEWRGREWILTNRAALPVFQRVYPEIRAVVGIDRFEHALPSLRTNAMRFIEEMDPIFMPERGQSAGQATNSIKQ